MGRKPSFFFPWWLEFAQLQSSKLRLVRPPLSVVTACGKHAFGVC